MAAKPAPRFGGGGEKCKTCDKTVYPQERISYDNGTWHQLCFKCLSCRSTLSLTAVAMINGQLYCKTCFKKTFLKEGRYTTFDKAQSDRLTQQMAQQQLSTDSPAAAAVVSGGSGSSTPVTASGSSGSASNSRSNSISLNSGSSAAIASNTPVAQLQAAVERKDVAACQTLLATGGAALLFERVKTGQTVLEWALTSYMHKATGVKLVEWLEGRVGEANRLMKQSGVASPLAGKEEGKLEESKESEPADAAPEASEVEVTA